MRRQRESSSAPAGEPDAWHAVAAASEVGRAPVQRSVAGEAVVLFRTQAAELVALADRCPHQGYALSCGHVFGDTIECSYHGWTFDAHGQCVEIPFQIYVPPELRIRRYACVERADRIWVWSGVRAEADDALIPNDPV